MPSTDVWLSLYQDSRWLFMRFLRLYVAHVIWFLPKWRGYIVNTLPNEHAEWIHYTRKEFATVYGGALHRCYRPSINKNIFFSLTTIHCYSTWWCLRDCNTGGCIDTCTINKCSIVHNNLEAQALLRCIETGFFSRTKAQVVSFLLLSFGDKGTRHRPKPHDERITRYTSAPAEIYVCS